MIETPRLILRQWRDSDYPCFAEMGTNPQVMQYFPNLLSRAESDALIDRMKLIIETKGWGFWAVELKETQQFIGLLDCMISPYNFIFALC
ncbi:acetyltransferase (GNAT) family protein [Acinetobacter haemolyticus]|nr:acetyltransferase (GNAT) family protein [Acinetobacter haemolyticus]